MLEQFAILNHLKKLWSFGTTEPPPITDVPGPMI